MHDQEGDQHGEGRAPLHYELRPRRAHDPAMRGMDQDE
jgi:hypothetical protein